MLACVAIGYVELCFAVKEISEEEGYNRLAPSCISRVADVECISSECSERLQSTTPTAAR